MVRDGELGSFGKGDNDDYNGVGSVEISRICATHYDLLI